MDKAPNNKFPGNPGIMNDGRFFTDYRPKADVNANLSGSFNNSFSWSVLIFAPPFLALSIDAFISSLLGFSPL